MSHRDRLVRGFVILALLAGFLAGPAGRFHLTARARGMALPPTFDLSKYRVVMISEFGSRGPGGEADEFIELYNRGLNLVSLADWTLRISDSLGRNFELFRFPYGAVLASGQHYLIASPTYTGAVVPDWTWGDFLSIPDEGGIALSGGWLGMMDRVGMSFGSAYLEGSPLPPMMGSLDQSYERKLGGAQDSCQDSGDNRRDFTLILPSAPQNSSAPIRLCGVGVQDTSITIDYDIPDPSVSGEIVNVYYHVISLSGTPAGGRVEISGINSYGCEGRLEAGQGGCSMLSGMVGPDSLVAYYSGHSMFRASTSPSEPHRVEKADTMTRITWDKPDPSARGQPLVVRVSVSALRSGLGLPTGDVVLSTGWLSCTARLQYGVGQCVLTFGGIGPKKITASYLGDSKYNPSTSQVEFHSVILPPTRTPVPSPTPTATSTPPRPLPARAEVVISEIAWAGTYASRDDEWIELFNRSYSPVDLSGWILRAWDGWPEIRLAGTLPARGYYLLERDDDTTIADIPADQIYKGALADTGEKLFLYDRFQGIVDRANAFSDPWAAGEQASRRSMERRNFFVDNGTSWESNNLIVKNGVDANGNPINGTPGRWNSSFFPTPSPTIGPTALTPSLVPGILPDLRVSGMRIELERSWCLLYGDHLGLSAWISNNGQARADSFVVSMDQEEQVLEGLEPGQGVSVFFHHFTVPVTIMLDSTYDIAESNEANNLVTEWVPVPTFPLPCIAPSLTPSPMP